MNLWRWLRRWRPDREKTALEIERDRAIDCWELFSQVMIREAGKYLKAARLLDKALGKGEEK